MSKAMSNTTAIILLVGVFAGVGSCAAIEPHYNVYRQRMVGEAEFQRAESNRQIKVREAQAALDSAKLTSAAEVERAKGVAEANKIIANSLGGPEGYLRWRYIEMLESGGSGNQIIYIPTEGAMPLLEAGRINKGVK